MRPRAPQRHRPRRPAAAPAAAQGPAPRRAPAAGLVSTPCIVFTPCIIFTRGLVFTRGLPFTRGLVFTRGLAFTLGLLCALVAATFAQAAPPPSSTRAPATIDWAQAQAAPAGAAATATRARLRAAVGPAELDAIALPVLLPADLAALAGPRLRHQRRSYVAAYGLPGARLSVTGFASAIVAPDGSALARQVRQFAHAAAAAPVFEPTDDGADLAFERFGAHYVLRLSCEVPADPRCRQRAFLDAVAAGLIVVGGRPQ